MVLPKKNMRKKYQPLNNRLHGWYRTFRGKLLLLNKRVLSKEEYLLYDSSVILCDWDEKHHETYGHLLLTQTEVEKLIGCSKGFVSRYGKELIKKGFWKISPNIGIQVLGIELISYKLLNDIVKNNKVVDLQKYLAETQQLVADEGIDISKKMHNIPPQYVANLQTDRSKYLISSKDKYFVPRSSEEYKRIYEESNCEGLSPEDMKLADESIFETMGINPT